MPLLDDALAAANAALPERERVSSAEALCLAGLAFIIFMEVLTFCTQLSLLRRVSRRRLPDEPEYE